MTRALVLALVAACAARAEPPRAAVPRPHLVFLLPDSQHTPELVALLSVHLRAGDTLMVRGASNEVDFVTRTATEARARVQPGVEVATSIWFPSIGELEQHVAELPHDIQWIAYDYERWDRTPEFDPAEAASLAFFERAATAAHAHGFRFLLSPYYEGGWRWSKLGEHVDAIDVQLQHLVRTPDRYVATARPLFRDLAEHAPHAWRVAQVSLVFTRGTPEDNVDAIRAAASDPDIAAFLVFFGDDQVSALRDFFSAAERTWPRAP